MTLLGPKQVSILRSTCGRWFDCAGRNALYRACMRLEARHLLSRDPHNKDRFTATLGGIAAIEAHDDAIAARHGMSRDDDAVRVEGRWI